MFDPFHRWLPGISHTAAFVFFAILGPLPCCTPAIDAVIAA